MMHNWSQGWKNENFILLYYYYIIFYIFFFFFQQRKLKFSLKNLFLTTLSYLKSPLSIKIKNDIA